MDFDFSRMKPADDPFFGIVPGKASYPVGRVTLPVTFGTPANYRTEYINFEMPAPNGVISVRGDIKTCFECDSEAVRLTERAQQLSNSSLLVEEAKKVAPDSLRIPEPESSPMAIESTVETKDVSLGLDDPSKTVKIGASLTKK
ncbi:unnamed protein product [Urochloa humidicola]